MNNLPNQKTQIALVEEAQTKPSSNLTLLKQFREEAEKYKNALNNLCDTVYEAHAPLLKNYLTTAFDAQMTANSSRLFKGKPPVSPEVQKLAQKSLDDTLKIEDEKIAQYAEVSKPTRRM